MTEQNLHPVASQPIWVRPMTVTVLVASLFGLGLTACGDEVEDVISFAEYIGASADVLDANGMEPKADLDCDGDSDTNDVTCTGTTTDGLSIESTGENLGEDTATLVVIVDGEILYDGLLDEAP
ncbi:MAG: hypothetical protein GY724_29625 [Actinomycetia bacterium]|nr:hypothetical protein [Actinomycetes bacterium]MCP5033797.1 hypothetical protein [Actinomycetes bacterium]